MLNHETSIRKYIYKYVCITISRFNYKLWYDLHVAKNTLNSKKNYTTVFRGFGRIY